MMQSNYFKSCAFCPSTPIFKCSTTNLSSVSNRSTLRPLHYVKKPSRITAAAHPPRKVGNVAKDLREALQKSLQSRTSRIQIQLPFGAKLGTEKRDNKDETIEQQRISGDRELGRIVSGMFDGTGLLVCVVFASEHERSSALRLWGPLFKCQTAVWSSSSSKKKIKKKRVTSQGFGTSSSSSEKQLSDDEIDVFITVGGGSALMQSVKLFSQSVGMDKLIIIANGNSVDDKLSIDVLQYLNDEFENVYHYQPNPNPKWNGGVLFRKFPDEWVFCRLTGIGLLQELIKSDKKPSMEEIEGVLKDEEKKGDNQVLKTLNNLMDFGR